MKNLQIYLVVKNKELLLLKVIFEPEILILDEPTSSLDDDNKNIILNFLKSIKNKTTIIIVSHEEDYFELSDNIYELVNKKFIKTK